MKEKFTLKFNLKDKAEVRFLSSKPPVSLANVILSNQSCFKTIQGWRRHLRHSWQSSIHGHPLQSDRPNLVRMQVQAICSTGDKKLYVTKM